MKIVKTILRNRIGDEFMSHCIICFVEQGFLATIPIKDIIVRFNTTRTVTVELNAYFVFVTICECPLSHIILSILRFCMVLYFTKSVL